MDNLDNRPTGVVFERVSVRKFSDKPIEEKKICALLRAGMQAPSGGNQQPWQFVVVDDPALLEGLSGASKFSGPAGNAPVCIVPVIDATGARFPELVQLDLSACVENILLEAVELGLGAVWLCVYPEEDRIAYVRSLLRIPEEMTPFAIVPVGYPSDQMREQQDRFSESRVHNNIW